MKEKNVKITLLGSNSGRNAGDAAILAAIMGVLHKEFDGKVEFEVPTTNPSFVTDNYGQHFNVKPINIMPWTGSIRLLGIPTLLSIKRTDLTFITDGIIFDINLFNPLFNFLITLVGLVPWLRFWKKKLICYSVGIGPLNSKAGQMFARYVGNSSDLIMVRDEDSRALFEKIGITKEIHLTADAVFANWSASPERIDELLIENSIDSAASDGNLLGVNITRYIDRWLQSHEKVSAKDKFLPELADVIVKLRKEQGITTALFITQVMDAEFGKILQQLVKEKSKQLHDEQWEPAFITNEIYTNHEILGLASRCKLLVGMRLHSLIIAARAGTPVVGLVYAPKVRSFLKQLGTPERSIELAEMSSERLYTELVDAWKNVSSIKTTQQEIVRTLESNALDAGRIVRELVQGQETLLSETSKSRAINE